MTSVNAPWESSPDSPVDGSTPSRWTRLEMLLERGSEWLNPILVKEARQALKSQQFVVTFGLLLLFGWMWTLFGVWFASPGIFYGAAGKGMLYGYFLVLSIPLIVVVPFSAFRSLAAEREDGTFELISITALSARQIVGGKLGSAILQMLVYFSALAPCVAFTYLLRGVDVFSIFFVLYYTFMMSLLLSTVALLVATASRARHWQVLLSVLLMLLLFVAAIIWAVFIWTSLDENVWTADEWEFWALQVMMFTMMASFCLLFQWAAAAQISFASDNRSTRLRWVMLVQQTLWIGWTAYAHICFPTHDLEVVYTSMIFAFCYWLLMGSLLVGERPQLSPRVQRELPHSFLGRMGLTWFNPGSGTGYLFAIINMGTLLSVLQSVASFPQVGNNGTVALGWPEYMQLSWFCILMQGYLICYLGATRLVLVLARKMAAVGMVFSLLITCFFLLAGTAFPLILQSWLFDFRVGDYTEMQVTNWIWTLAEARYNSITDHYLVPLVVLPLASLIMLTNLYLAGREVALVRVAAPLRVQEDDAALHPVAIKKASSPWDDDLASTEMPPGS